MMIAKRRRRIEQATTCHNKAIVKRADRVADGISVGNPSSGPRWRSSQQAQCPNHPTCLSSKADLMLISEFLCFPLDEVNAVSAECVRHVTWSERRWPNIVVMLKIRAIDTRGEGKRRNRETVRAYVEESGIEEVPFQDIEKQVQRKQKRKGLRVSFLLSFRNQPPKKTPARKIKPSARVCHLRASSQSSLSSLKSVSSDSTSNLVPRAA